MTRHVALLRTLVCALVPLMLSAPAARAQAYPTQPVKLIVPFGAGGSLDVLARLVGEPLGKALGQPIVIDNRPGAAGNLAAEVTAKAEPDGHTLLVVPSAFAVNATLYTNLRFDPRKDFSPIAMLGATQNVLVANMQFPAQSVRDVIARAKAQPGKIDYASTGVGTSGHLTFELFKTLAGVDLTHVPYRSIGQETTDLIAGVVPLAMPSIPGAMGHIETGKLRGLAVSGKSRSPVLPAVPTMAEAGVAGYEATTWYALLGPAGVPRAAVARINAEIGRLLRDPAFGEKLSKQGIEPMLMSPDELSAYIASEIDKWAAVVKAANLKPD
jgi:tripartite-type tricarboxylate transporter receptor subunit TctC